MKFTIQREDLLKPLQALAGIVERRQTLPILANVLITLNQHQLSLSGTDLETELTACVDLGFTTQSGGAITVSARKVMDICRSLPEKVELVISLDGQKLLIRAGKSRFALATLPAGDFPTLENHNANLEIELTQKDFRYLLERTQFAMAHQDVRYYLNGLLLQITAQQIRAVTTDGHRLAMAFLDSPTATESCQIIIPRKAVTELLRLINQSNETVSLAVSQSHIQVQTAEFKFNSKLIDGRFPDYDKVLPKNGDKIIILDRDLLRQALSRASILSHEKSKGIRLQLRANLLRIIAQNHEQEEAEEELSVIYTGEDLDIGINVTYLLDVLAVMEQESVKLTLINANTSILIEEADNSQSVYVIMPMRL